MSTDILSSIHTARTLEMLRKTESNYLRASDYLAASFEQLSQVNEALKTVGMLFKEMGRPSLSSSTKNFLVLSPLVVSGMTYLDMRTANTKKTFIWITEHYGQITRSVNLFATAVLFLYGKRFVAIASFLTYGICYLSENEYFSEKTAKIIDSTIVIPSSIYFLVVGNFFDRLLAICELAIKAKQLTKDYQTKQEKSLHLVSKRHAADEFTLKDLLRIAFDRVEIDSDHLKIKPYASNDSETRSLKDCEEALNKIGHALSMVRWEKHAHVLLKKLSLDLHWNDQSTVPEKIFPMIQELNALWLQKSLTGIEKEKEKNLLKQLTPYAIEFFQEGVQILIMRLKTRSAEIRGLLADTAGVSLKCRQRRHGNINLGISSKAYKESVEKLYFSVARYLGSQENDMSKADALLALGVEAGDYCCPQVLDILRETEASLAEIGKDLTLRDGILNIFYERRVNYIKNVWGKFLQLIPSSVVENLGLNSPHLPHVLMALHGKKIGAESIGSENDAEAQSTITEGASILMTPLTKLFADSFFTECYTKENLVQWIHEEVLSERISSMSIQNWFQEHLYLEDFSMIWNEDYTALTDEAIMLLLVKLRIFNSASFNRSANSPPR